MVHTYCKSHVIIKSGIITMKCVIILHLPFSLDGRVSEREREKRKRERERCQRKNFRTQNIYLHENLPRLVNLN